ncbi:MAG: hypothetical protein WB566_12810 [Terriglobales bacterium]
MHIPRLLLLALLIAVCVAPVVAQSSLAPDKIPSASQPRLDGLIAPPEFRTHVLPLDRSVRARIRDIQPELTLDSNLDSTLDSVPAQDEEDCLTMRTYRVTRDDPRSDSTRLAGYSECQPAARFQMKTAMDSQEIAPR